MNYNLKKPCSSCPFRSDKLFPLHPSRARNIIYGNGEFACHKTVDYSDDSEGRTKSKSEHCAGLLILLEHMGQPHQMMRVSERLGAYDRHALDMTAPVYTDGQDYIDALSD
jgi:hypothetical protein